MLVIIFWGYDLKWLEGRKICVHRRPCEGVFWGGGDPSEWYRNAFGMISGRFRVLFCANLGVFYMLFECKNTKRKRLNQIFCDFGDDELCKKGGLPQCLLGKIYFHDRFWTNNLTRQSVRYYKSKCGLQKNYFLPFISVFTLINSELRNFSSDKVTHKLLTLNDLRCHLSLVTFAFTLSFNVLYAFFMQKKFVDFRASFLRA